MLRQDELENTPPSDLEIGRSSDFAPRGPRASPLGLGVQNPCFGKSPDPEGGGGGGRGGGAYIPSSQQCIITLYRDLQKMANNWTKKG